MVRGGGQGQREKRAMAVFLLVVLVAGLFLGLCLWKPVTQRQVKLWFALAGLLGTLLVGAAAFSC